MLASTHDNEIFHLSRTKEAAWASLLGILSVIKLYARVSAMPLFALCVTFFWVRVLHTGTDSQGSKISVLFSNFHSSHHALREDALLRLVKHRRCFAEEATCTRVYRVFSSFISMVPILPESSYNLNSLCMKRAPFR